MTSGYVVRPVRDRLGSHLAWAVYPPRGTGTGFSAAYTGSFAWLRARLCAVRLNRRAR